jgi:mRNA interferase RelE/StbE
LSAWRVAIDPAAAKDLRKLGSRDRERVMRFLRERIATTDDPRRLGHALTGLFARLWSYRIGDLRVIASIQDEKVTVLVVRVGNRREIYR